MAKQRNYSQELLAAQNKGMRVVCAVAPYEGVVAEYKPRSKRDPRPWVLGGYDETLYRYSGRECTTEGKPVFEQARDALITFYADWIGDTDCKPVLIENWESDYGSVHTVLMWEEGPDEWTLSITHHDEPIHVLLKGWPIEVAAEPYNSWTMSIYLQD